MAQPAPPSVAAGHHNRILLADFFCGAGGATLGFSQAGIAPTVAVEVDESAAATYRANFPAARLIQGDIRDLPTTHPDLGAVGDTTRIRLFAGCAPCQPFSGHQQQARHGDPRNGLLMEFLRFVRAFEPELVFVENVAGIARHANTHSPFDDFVAALSQTHEVTHATVLSADYGVPQIRRRLVLLASTLGRITIPQPTHGATTHTPHSTVRDWIDATPPIVAGQQHAHIASHRAANLSAKNLARIRATPEGGSRRDWPEHLRVDCHKDTPNMHTDTYGRMRWDRPAPALTTRCVSFSNGRYGHPDQDRAISVHEAALLQTFPADYRFVGTINSQARQVGNAVPVLLAQRCGEHLAAHIDEHRR